MTQNSAPIRTRFAPSPTGFLHIGGARTALFCWLAARATGGQFILRIEDTDRERSTEESVQAILDGMQWLALDHDEGPFFQSERFDRYQAVVDQLLEQGQAYRCYCSRERLDELRARAMDAGEKPRYDGHCRDLEHPPEGVEPVIRFRNPDEGTVVFEDRVRGRIEVANQELDDLVIMRADGSPTYNFAVVIDDLDMDINLVIRGDDHINNTPRQINVYRALGQEPPEFAHVPMILGDDGARLSKRHGAVSVMAWREQGYLPDALINYLARLGWSHGDDEVFSREQLIELFRIEDVNRKASRFDTEKLNWLNQHYLREGDRAQLHEELRWHLARTGLEADAGPDLDELLSVQADRVETLVELVERSRPFFEDFSDFEAGAAKKHLRPVAAEPLKALRERLEALEDWQADALQDAVQATADALGVGFGKIGMPLRVALMGHGESPAINQTLRLAGRERSLARIDRALEFIAEREAGQSA
ncbi:glutamate--tRNA ligase [Wenzhouxiangella marina]|uniref:Glutamate--tRNA ligase n=1 Tax=Wenzhouxiangella marina TaxID=1579979 RepID=A0A0K0XX32_9GAMM|nr:glutamate--tRNA ligase [Wenzhouxiangella marina]AKS42238.1 glutamyl-tRNA synthetase [Wenzhouxiangella marina]MBB6085990.1 glutamyl-tRNA synthetase [Wenzhouxiangella marina]